MRVNKESQLYKDKLQNFIEVVGAEVKAARAGQIGMDENFNDVVRFPACTRKELATDIEATAALIGMIENGRLTGVQTLFDIAWATGRTLKIVMAPNYEVKIAKVKKRKKV